MAVKGADNVYDCAAKAEDGEPYFTLLARDPLAAMLVRLWAMLAELLGLHPKAKIEDAESVAEQMEAWRMARGDFDEPSPTALERRLATALLGQEYIEWFVDGARCMQCHSPQRQNFKAGMEERHNTGCLIQAARKVDGR